MTKLINIAFMVLGCYLYSPAQTLPPLQKGELERWDVIPAINGMTLISDHELSLKNGETEINIHNGKMDSVRNRWPVGWSKASIGLVLTNINILTEKLGRMPVPAEVAQYLNIPLGEYEYIFSKIKAGAERSIWSDNYVNNNEIQFVFESKDLGVKNYLHVPASNSIVLSTPEFQLNAGKPHVATFKVKTNLNPKNNSLFCWFNTGNDEIKVGYYSFPNTNGEWKFVSYFFRAPSEVKSGHFTLYFPSDELEFIDIASLKIKSITEKNFSEAYQIERKQLVEYTPNRTGKEGENLALTIAKLRRKAGIPGKPFLIWGVGSSFTSSLDDLEPIRQAILNRFPNAPEVVYKRRVGSGCPYDFALGWVQNDIIAEQPDLIISYTNGSLRGLESLLKEIRSKSTADIIIPSLHFFYFEQINEKTINTPELDSIRRICTKYHAQFIENRQEIAEWLLKENRPITDLLKDHVHQNSLGKQIIGENIANHFRDNESPTYDYTKLEKRFNLAEEFNRKNSNLIIKGNWSIDNGQLITHDKNASIKLSFIGNRVDLIGFKIKDGGCVKVFIDGQQANLYPAYSVSYVKPSILNVDHWGKFSRASSGNRDTGPHGVSLGKNILPQKWTLRMIDDVGNYELIGSITQKDGNGSRKNPFISNSGQIIIDPKLWRAPKANVKGDFWTFDVSRATKGLIEFNQCGSEPFLFSETIAQNLENDRHTVEIITENQNEVRIESFYVFEPMLSLLNIVTNK